MTKNHKDYGLLVLKKKKAIRNSKKRHKKLSSAHLRQTVPSIRSITKSRK